MKAFCIVALAAAALFGQAAISGTKWVEPNCWFLGLPGGISATSTLTYNPDSVQENGAAFVLTYRDPGGSGMDGYPNGGVGGCKIGGKWVSGDSTRTGLPVQLKNLPSNLWLYWKSSQDSNAFDEDDKWESSVNFIFDYGTAVSEPVDSARDFDLVVLLRMQNFDERLDDSPRESATDAYWYFARNNDGSLRTYNLSVEGVSYSFAVRYKFFKLGDKADKIHVKFIPANGIPPYFHQPIHELIDSARSFVSSAQLNAAEQKIAQEKLAPDSIWLKSIRGGYEVYTGESTLRQDYFKTIVVPQVVSMNHRVSHKNASISVQGNSLLFHSEGVRTVELFGLNGRKLFSLNISGTSFAVPADLNGVMIARVSGTDGISIVKLKQ